MRFRLEICRGDRAVHSILSHGVAYISIDMESKDRLLLSPWQSSCNYNRRVVKAGYAFSRMHMRDAEHPWVEI